MAASPAARRGRPRRGGRRDKSWRRRRRRTCLTRVSNRRASPRPAPAGRSGADPASLAGRVTRLPRLTTKMAQHRRFEAGTAFAGIGPGGVRTWPRRPRRRKRRQPPTRAVSVVVTCRQFDDLDAHWAGLDAQTLAAAEFEVILVDARPGDDQAMPAERAYALSTARAASGRLAEAWNRAIDQA